MAGLRIAGFGVGCDCCGSTTFTCGGCSSIPAADLTLSWTSTAACGNGSCILFWDSVNQIWSTGTCDNDVAFCPGFFSSPGPAGLKASLSCGVFGILNLAFVNCNGPTAWCTLASDTHAQGGNAVITTTYTCDPFSVVWDFSGCTAPDPNIHNCCAGSFSLAAYGFTTVTLTP